ncbi:MAG: S8 family serine peptidase [Prolixibacteraceae bacterium]
MKESIIIIIGALLLTLESFAQCDECNFESNKLRVIVNKDQLERVKKGNDILSTLFSDETKTKHKIIKATQSFPYSKNEYLQRVYKIEFDGELKKFKKELEKNKEKFEKTFRLPIEEKIAVYDPSDYMWDHNHYLWHLEQIDAEHAWDITKGSSDTKIAVLDTWFDINHPDLSTKIDPHYDPYDNTNYTTDCKKENHGTAVASFISAETDGGGQLASIGFNCRIIAFQAWDLDYLERAHFASLSMGADVITSSAGGWTCGGSLDPIDKIAVQEILDNGTIIVMPAGNGIKITSANDTIISTRCRPSGSSLDRPWFPLSPLYDERIIIVSSVDEGNYHTYTNGEGTTYIHSFFPEVDICAGGYNVLGAKCTTELDSSNNCVNNSWPYGGCYGTSFSTPIVAGVCGLMKSINPCITPAEAQAIIKETAGPILDENLYSGMLGAGIINAYESVRKAGTIEYINETLSGTQNVSSGYAFYLDNVTIDASSNITLTAKKKVDIDGTFSVPIGSTFAINIDPNASFICY